MVARHEGINYCVLSYFDPKFAGLKRYPLQVSKFVPSQVPPATLSVTANLLRLQEAEFGPSA